MRWFIIALVLLLFAFTANAEVAIPPLKSPVTDLTGTLSNGEKTYLSNRVTAFEKVSGSQISVLIIPTTKPEELKQYSIRAANQWKLGRKGIADGILLIIAKNDHKMTISVGRGLEGTIPDAIAERITSEIISPEFKKGDFYTGVNAGISTLIKLIDGEHLPPVKQITTIEIIKIIGLMIVSLFLALYLNLYIPAKISGQLGKFLGAFISSLMIGGMVALPLVNLGWETGITSDNGAIVALIIGIVVFIILLWLGNNWRLKDNSNNWEGSSGSSFDDGGSSGS